MTDVADHAGRPSNPFHLEVGRRRFQLHPEQPDRQRAGSDAGREDIKYYRGS